MADLSTVSTNFFATPKEGFTTTTASSVSSGAATVPLNSVTGYTNGAIATFVIEPTSQTAKQVFTGVVDTSGVQLTSVKWTEGTNQTHNAGSTVVDYTTATHFAALVKGLLIDHAQNGGHNTLHDSNGNTILGQTATASAVNYVRNTNNVTGSPPKLTADGTDTNIDLYLAGKGTGRVSIDSEAEWAFDFITSGGVWSGDSYASTRNASMTAVVAWINGQRLSSTTNSPGLAAVTARSFTASKDTYVDILNTSGVGTLVYTEVANNAASPALAANSLRLAIIITGATNIASAGSVNQGQETMVLPIASSVAYSVTDSLGNLICPRDPNRKILGYKQITTALTTLGLTTTDLDLTGLAVPFIAPGNRKVKVTIFAPDYSQTGGIGTCDALVKIKEGATVLQYQASTASTVNFPVQVNVVGLFTPSAGLHTYKASMATNLTGPSWTFDAGATDPAYIMVELA